MHHQHAACVPERIRRLSLFAAALWTSAAFAPFVSGDEGKVLSIAGLDRKTPVSFKDEVLPLLRKNCLACHSAAEANGELVLETPQAMLKGGENGPAIVEGKGGESLLLKVASHRMEPIMPPADNDVAAQNLTPKELGLLKLWIDQGAKGDVGSGVLSPAQWRPLPPGLNPIYAVAVSPDGQFAACGRANQIFIYHVSTGQLVTRLTDPSLKSRDANGLSGLAHLDIVQSLSFNNAGDRLASGGFRVAKLWRRPRDVQEHQLAAGAAVTAMAAQPDGEQVAVATADNKIRVWSLPNQKTLAVLEGHTDHVTGLKYSSDGRRLVSVSKDKSIRLWDDKGELLGRIDTASELTAVDFVREAAKDEKQPERGLRLITGGADKMLRLWSVPAAPVDLAAEPKAKVIAVSNDRKRLALAGGDGRLHVVNVADNKTEKVWQAHDREISAVDFSVDGKRLATGGDKGEIRLWELSSGKQLQEVRRESAVVRGVAFLPDGKRLVAGYSDNTVSIWSLDTKPEAEELSMGGFSKPVSAVEVSADGRIVYASSLDGTLRGFNAVDGKQMFSATHGAPIRGFALSPDGKLLASAGENKVIRLWNPSNGRAVQPNQLSGFESPVTRVAFDADSKRVVGGSGAGELLVFNLSNAGEVEQRRATGKTEIVCLAALDATAMVSADGTSMQRWELNALRRYQGHSQPVTAIAALPTAVFQVLSGSDDRSVRHWNLANGQVLRQMNHGGPVSVVAVRPDGTRFASAGANKIAKLWNSANGQQVAEMKGDLRARSLVVSLNQQLTAANARVTEATAAIKAAETELPKRQASEKTATEALAKADADLKKNSETLKSTGTAKVAAEKLAIEAAAAAKQAAVAEMAAQQTLAAAESTAAVAAAEVTRAQARAADSPKDKQLAAAKTQADQQLANAMSQVKAAQAAVAAPKKLAADTAKKAAAEAAKAVATGKPYNTALAANVIAEREQKLAAQKHVLAVKEAKQAADAIPAAKALKAEREKAVAAAKTSVESATKAASDAEQPLISLAFSPDNQQLATCGRLPIVHTWDADKGGAVASFHGHQSSVVAVQFSSTGALLSGSEDKTVISWNRTPAWRLERTIGAIDRPEQLENRVVTLDFSDDGRLLATGGGTPSRNGEVKIWNVDDGTLVRAINDAHTDAVFGVAFSKDGKFLASAGADKFVRVFEVSTGKEVHRFEGHTNHVLGVSWKSDGNRLASCGADNTVRTWNTQTGDRLRTLQGFKKQVSSVRFVGETNLFLICTGDRIVRMYNSDNGGIVRTFAGAGDDFLYSVDVTPNSRTVISGGYDSKLRIWSGTANNAQPAHVLSKPTDDRTAATRE